MCAGAAYYERNGFGSAPRHSWSGQSQHHLQQHGCASARRSSLGWSCWSSCSWKGISKHSRGDHLCSLGTGVKPPAQKENVEGEKRSQVNMYKVHERAGNRKKTGFGSRGPGIIQQARSLLHVACSGHALLHERCLDVLLPRAQLRFNLQLDGFSQWAFSERGGVCTAEIPSYAQKGSSFF